MAKAQTWSVKSCLEHTGPLSQPPPNPVSAKLRRCAFAFLCVHLMTLASIVREPLDGRCAFNGGRSRAFKSFPRDAASNDSAYGAFQSIMVDPRSPPGMKLHLQDHRTLLKGLATPLIVWINVVSVGKRGQFSLGMSDQCCEHDCNSYRSTWDTSRAGVPHLRMSVHKDQQQPLGKSLSAKCTDPAIPHTLFKG